MGIGSDGYRTTDEVMRGSTFWLEFESLRDIAMQWTTVGGKKDFNGLNDELILHFCFT